MILPRPDRKSLTLGSKRLQLGPKSFQKSGVGTTVEGQNITYYSDDDRENPSSLLFLKGLLYCPSYPDSIPPGSTGPNNYNQFNQIEAEGLVDIEIRQGNRYSVQKSGPANVINHLDISQLGDVLEIDMDEDYFNLKNRFNYSIMRLSCRFVYE